LASAVFLASGEANTLDPGVTLTAGAATGAAAGFGAGAAAAAATGFGFGAGAAAGAPSDTLKFANEATKEEALR